MKFTKSVTPNAEQRLHLAAIRSAKPTKTGFVPPKKGKKPVRVTGVQLSTFGLALLSALEKR